MCYDTKTNNKSNNLLLVLVGCTRVLPEINLKFRRLKYSRSEKIINYLALAKYTLALFLIRRYKNQATSKFSSPGMQSTHLIWLILSFSDELPLNKNNYQPEIPRAYWCSVFRKCLHGGINSLISCCLVMGLLLAPAHLGNRWSWFSVT